MNIFFKRHEKGCWFSRIQCSTAIKEFNKPHFFWQHYFVELNCSWILSSWNGINGREASQLSGRAEPNILHGYKKCLVLRWWFEYREASMLFFHQAPDVTKAHCHIACTTQHSGKTLWCFPINLDTTDAIKLKEMLMSALVCPFVVVSQPECTNSISIL